MTADHPETKPHDDVVLPIDSSPTDPANSERPLPPIPDGGLAAAMPDWLRPSPATTAEYHRVTISNGYPSDFSTILTDEDLPEWLRRFGDRPPQPDGDAAPIEATAPPISDVGNPSHEIPPSHVRVELSAVQAGSPLPERGLSFALHRFVPWGVGAILLALAIAMIVLILG